MLVAVFCLLVLVLPRSGGLVFSRKQPLEWVGLGGWDDVWKGWEVWDGEMEVEVGREREREERERGKEKKKEKRIKKGRK
jgi:hypothetical protein